MVRQQNQTLINMMLFISQSASIIFFFFVDIWHVLLLSALPYSAIAVIQYTFLH